MKHFDEFTCKIDTYMHNTPSHNNEIKRGKEWIPHCSCKWLERTKESKLNRSAAVIMISDVRFCGSFILIPFRMLITFPIFGMARIYSNWQTKDFCSQMSLEQYLCMSHKSRQTNTEFSSYLIKFRMVAAFVFLSYSSLSVSFASCQLTRWIMIIASLWIAWISDGNGPRDCDVIHVKNCNNSLLIITFRANCSFICTQRAENWLREQLVIRKYTQYTPVTM